MIPEPSAQDEYLIAGIDSVLIVYEKEWQWACLLTWY